MILNICLQFKRTVSYYFEKVFESVRGEKHPEFGAVHLQALKRVLQELQVALERRGLGLDTFDSIQEIGRASCRERV